MKINIAARKMDLTDAIRGRIEQKYAKLDRFFQDDAEAKVTLSTEKDKQKIETSIHFHSFIIRVEHTSADLYNAIDKSVDDIIRQLRKHKTRLHNKLRSGYTDEIQSDSAIEEPDFEETEFNIVKKKTFSIKPMSAEEAILQMNLLNHQFYVFKDFDNFTKIVYKRKDDDYAMIEIN